MAEELTGKSAVDTESTHDHHHHHVSLEAMRAELVKLEGMLCGGHHPVEEVSHAIATGARHVPAWLRQTKGEARWAVSIAVLTAVALQLLLPDVLALGPTWLLPVPELVLFVVLVVANPVRICRESRLLRLGSLSLIAVISVANAWSAVTLVVRRSSKSVCAGGGCDDRNDSGSVGGDAFQCSGDLGDSGQA
jgi:hypothetical protein